MSDFDWVTARAECSLKSTFHALYEEIKSNVQTATKLNGKAKFNTLYQHNKVIVSREEDDDEVESIVFELTATAIMVTQIPDKILFSALPSITREKVCRLEVNGEPLEVWQVSMKALEGLFFGS